MKVPNPTAFMLFGEIGLILLVVEAGLEVDLLVLKQIGLRGLVIGILGSFVPLGIGYGMALVLGMESNAALACGACFAPTSMGVAVVVMKKKNVLNTPVGQLIVAAAVIDDIVALVILSELQALASGNGFLGFFLPILSAVGFSLIVGSVAVFYMPNLIKKENLKFISDQLYEHSMLSLLLIFVIGLMVALHYGKGSHLLGAFLAGLCFCTCRPMDDVWHSQIKRIMKWLLRIFFGASVGFQVPIKTFWTGKVLGMGFAFCLAIFGKFAMGLLADPFTKANIYTVGLAMSTWGEFAFIIAVSGKAEGLIDEDQFAAVILAVLLSVIFMPLALSNTIEHFQNKTKENLKNAMPRSPSQLDVMTTAEKDEAGFIYYKLDVRVRNTWGVLTSIIRLIKSNNLEMVEFFSVIEQGYVVYEAYLKDTYLMNKSCSTKDPIGLRDRIGNLEKTFMEELIQYDPETCIAHETEDLSALHGLCLVRWLPTAEDVDWVEFTKDEKIAQITMQESGFKQNKQKYSQLLQSGPDAPEDVTITGRNLSARDFTMLYPGLLQIVKDEADKAEKGENSIELIISNDNEEKDQESVPDIITLSKSS
jgi:Kef-type K+ transport system membrane component KefB